MDKFIIATKVWEEYYSRCKQEQWVVPLNILSNAYADVHNVDREELYKEVEMIADSYMEYSRENDLSD